MSAVSGLNSAASDRAPRHLKRPGSGGGGLFGDEMAKAAAPSPESGAPLAFGTSVGIASIEAGFDVWLQRAGKDGAGEDFLSRAAGARDGFLDVARKAERQGGYANALAFVRGLGADELHALQVTHDLADPIDTSKLTEEGAFNLLLPANMSRDLDKDGLTMTGSGAAIVFPPRDAPAGFAKAWEETTKDMDFGDRLTLQLSVWMQARGTGGEGAKADYEKPGFDYRALVDRSIESARINLGAQRTEAQKAYALRMLTTLENLGARLDAAAA